MCKVISVSSAISIFVVVHLVHLLSAYVIGAGDLGFKFRVGRIGRASPMARYRCDVLLELCSLGAKPRRWAPQLVTRFGVILRVKRRFDFCNYMQCVRNFITKSFAKKQLEIFGWMLRHTSAAIDKGANCFVI